MTHLVFASMLWYMCFQSQMSHIQDHFMNTHICQFSQDFCLKCWFSWTVLLDVSILEIVHNPILCFLQINVLQSKRRSEILKSVSGCAVCNLFRSFAVTIVYAVNVWGPYKDFTDCLLRLKYSMQNCRTITENHLNQTQILTLIFAVI